MEERVYNMREKLSDNLAHEFSVNFGDAVDGTRALYCQVWSRISR